MKTGKQTTNYGIIFTGFGVGLVVLIIYYLNICRLFQDPFSFRLIINIHRQIPLSWLFDFLPFAGILLALLYRKKMLLLKSFYIEKIEDLEERETRVLTFLKGLSRKEIGNNIEKPDTLPVEALDVQELLYAGIDRENQLLKENQQHLWYLEGLVRFNQILDQNIADLEDLTFKILSELIRYLDANQGGFFIKQADKEGEYILNMISCYAYNRKKFADKQVGWNEGFIGSVAEEKKTIYLTDIPDGYIEITSGLGKANPKYLLVTPVIYGEELQGVIEIASFKAFEKTRIEFTEQVARMTARALLRIGTTTDRDKLISDQQANQEKISELRKALTEKTDEFEILKSEATRQGSEFESFSTTVNHTLIRAEYNVEGRLLYANTKFLQKLGYSGNQEVEGKNISIFIDKKDMEWFNTMWAGLATGGAHFEGFMKHVSKTGQDVWTLATYTCVRKEDGGVEKVLFLGIDSTEQRKQALDFEGQLQAIDRLNVKAEFSPDGKLLSSNKLFENVFRYPEGELEKVKIFDFIDEKDLENVSDTWEKIITGQAFQSQIRMLTKYQEEKWFRASFTAVKDMYGEISKVIFLASEITNERMMEAENRNQTEILKRQEEKFRLENMTLSRDLKSLRNRMDTLIKDSKFMESVLEGVISLTDKLSLVFNDRGEIHFISEPALQFFGLKKEMEISFTKDFLRLMPENQRIDFWVNLLEPGNFILPDSKKILLSNRKDKKILFRLRIKKESLSKREIITVLLSPEKQIDDEM